MRDLVVLVADKNTEHVCRGALPRHQALGIRPLDFEVLVDPGRDGGVRRRGSQILAVQRTRFRHGLLIFDYEGSGATMPAPEVEVGLDRELSLAWGDQAKAIVIEPALDVWMWGADAHIRDVVSWEKTETIRDWLTQRSFVFHPNGKPDRPKEALEAVFREGHVPRSSANYEAIAGRLSIARCQDAAFKRLQAALTAWFPSSQR